MEALLKEDDGYLLALWENSSEFGKKVLAATASCVREAGLPVASTNIARQLGLDPDQDQRILSESLEELNRRRLLLRVPKTLDFPGSNNTGNSAAQEKFDVDTFLFAFDLLRRWLVENQPYSEELYSPAQKRALPSPF